ncbi:MAG: type II toxin-antitoxin system PemK/MazF family toxin [Candidatus Latescibacteria bacterium]|nr:type II toxin-antitoxin system PemK/MazF family toxin [Candidatus Latescibacterota bacterium]
MLTILSYVPYLNKVDNKWRHYEDDSSRPVLILTRDSALSFLSSVTIAPLTSTIRGTPTEVILTPEDGVQTACAVNLDNIQTVSKSNLQPFITHLSPTKMHEV